MAPMAWAGVERRREHEIDVPLLVAAICEVENGNPYGLGGAACITKEAWEDTEKTPYADSADPVKSARAYRNRIMWLMRGLEKHHIAPTVRILAQCWLVGLEGYLITRRTGKYAARVENVYSAN